MMCKCADVRMCRCANIKRLFQFAHLHICTLTSIFAIMSRKLIYLVNPISGTKEKNSLTKLIQEKTVAHQLPFEILPTVASGDYTFLKEKIREEKITDVVICGGDGS